MKKRMILLSLYLIVSLLFLSSAVFARDIVTPWRHSWMASQCGDGIYNDWETTDRCAMDCPSLIGCYDTDNDGLNNHAEVREGTNIRDADTDDDGLLDGEELYMSIPTNPLNDDSDGDSYLDSEEVAARSHPLDPLRTPLLDLEVGSIDSFTVFNTSGVHGNVSTNDTIVGGANVSTRINLTYNIVNNGYGHEVITNFERVKIEYIDYYGVYYDVTLEPYLGVDLYGYEHIMIGGEMTKVGPGVMSRSLEVELPGEIIAILRGAGVLDVRVSIQLDYARGITEVDETNNQLREVITLTSDDLVD